MSTKKLDKNGLAAVWNKIYSLMKIITGAVDVENDGDLQSQINNKVSVSDIVQNATTRDTKKIASAAVAADLQDQITAQNTNNAATAARFNNITDIGYRWCNTHGRYEMYIITAEGMFFCPITRDA